MIYDAKHIGIPIYGEEIENQDEKLVGINTNDYGVIYLNAHFKAYSTTIDNVTYEVFEDNKGRLYYLKSNGLSMEKNCMTDEEYFLPKIEEMPNIFKYLMLTGIIGILVFGLMAYYNIEFYVLPIIMVMMGFIGIMVYMKLLLLVLPITVMLIVLFYYLRNKIKSEH